MSLYPHQVEMMRALEAGASYIVSQPRTGKTRPVIEFMREKRVLVLTKKAAITGWLSELEAMGVTGWTVVNYEKVRTKGWDMALEWEGLVLDEAHVLSTKPKPNLVAPLVAKLKVTGPRVGVSATPCAESYGQLFHQVKGLKIDLWKDYKNFYAWFKDYGIPHQIKANGRFVETYSQYHDKAWYEFKAFCSVTDRQEVVSDFVEAEDIPVLLPALEVLEMCETLKRDELLRIGDRVILADSPLALAQKCQQICSGVVLDDKGEPVVVNSVKVEWLKRFLEAKIGVLCAFRAEIGAISHMYPEQPMTDEIGRFKDPSFNGWFVGNLTRFSSGVDLSQSEALVFTSCPWSAVNFLQARERLLRRDRAKSAPVYFPLIEGGIDTKIYSVVAVSKKAFTSRQYT